jgi:hypothetical protein
VKGQVIFRAMSVRRLSDFWFFQFRVRNLGRDEYILCTKRRSFANQFFFFLNAFKCQTLILKNCSKKKK